MAVSTSSSRWAATGCGRPSCHCPRQVPTSISPLRCPKGPRHRPRPHRRPLRRRASNAGSDRSRLESRRLLRHSRARRPGMRPAESHRDNIIARARRRQGEGTMKPHLRTLMKSAALAATALSISLVAPASAQRGAPLRPRRCRRLRARPKRRSSTRSRRSRPSTRPAPGGAIPTCEAAGRSTAGAA